MSVPDDTLRQVLRHLQTQALNASRELSLTNAQKGAKEREIRLSQLTRAETANVPRDDPDMRMYRAVGKMFMQESPDHIDKMLKTKEREATDDLSNLQKKLKHLEKEIASSQAGLREIFNTAQREQQS